MVSFNVLLHINVDEKNNYYKKIHYKNSHTLNKYITLQTKQIFHLRLNLSFHDGFRPMISAFNAKL